MPQYSRAAFVFFVVVHDSVISRRTGEIDIPIQYGERGVAMLNVNNMIIGGGVNLRAG